MPTITTNTNTKQTPMVSTGLTGVQSVKFVQAPRVYIKAVDSTPTPVVIKSNGAVPTGWTDLGTVNGLAKITYTKGTKDVRTGLEQVLRAQYINKRTSTVEAELAQFDDVVIATLTGLTASVVTSASIIQIGMGQESIINKAILLVAQNVLDGKEVQIYNPGAYVTLSYNNSGDETAVKMMCDFPSFQWASLDTQFVQSHFA